MVIAGSLPVESGGIDHLTGEIFKPTTGRADASPHMKLFFIVACFNQEAIKHILREKITSAAMQIF